MTDISFITFTRNSAERIAALIEHVRDVVNEIILVDGFSTDGTVEIARKYNAKVYSRKPWGFPEVDRMFAIKQASCEWILYLDDDERMGRKFKKDLNAILSCADNVSAFRNLRYEILPNGKPILGDFYWNWQTRIYRRSKVAYKGLVHEQPTINGLVRTLPRDYFILHFLRKSAKKDLFYTRLEALCYHRHRTRSVFRSLLWKTVPASMPFLYGYRIIIMVKAKFPFDIDTLIYYISVAKYETLVHTFMNLRDKKETARAQIVERKGLISLLGLR